MKKKIIHGNIIKNNSWKKRKLLKILIFTAIILISVPPLFSKISDKSYFQKIQKTINSGQIDSAKKLCYTFLKNYPQSNFVPDARLILAEYETDPEKAIYKFRIITGKYRYYTRKDYAQYKICEILYLLSRWNELKDESSAGINKYRNSRFIDNYRYFLVMANINLGKINQARDVCQKLIETNHNYNNLAKSLLILAYITNKTSGYSREYIYNLREIATGFNKSNIFQTVLYLLGKFYENRNDYNKAYSAYIDVIKKYPGSPEAYSAKKRILILKKFNPSIVKYIPSIKTIKTTDKIRIQHEIDLPEDDGPALIYYSIAMGPFDSKKRVNDIKNLLSGFGIIKTVYIKNRYTLFVGKKINSDEALKLKIRLAEEYGINGRIVRISGNNTRKYIYGE